MERIEQRPGEPAERTGEYEELNPFARLRVGVLIEGLPYRPCRVVSHGATSHHRAIEIWLGAHRVATIIAGITEFERELIQERIRSGIAAAKTRGKRLGRQLGQRLKSDRLAPKVLARVAKGRSYRLIGGEVGLSKNTVADIVKRNRRSNDDGLSDAR